MGGDAITSMARKIVRDNPDHPARGLARMLVKECRNAISLEAARRRVRGLLGVAGEKARKDYKAKDSRRAPRQAGVVYTMPTSLAEDWTPHVLGVTGRVGVLSDIHMPFHSERAVESGVRHLQSIGIDALVLNGDLCDFYTISRHQKDPRKRDFSGELESCRQFMGWIRQEFPSIPIVMKAGNHEERWQHYIWQHAPELCREPRMNLHQWLDLINHDITLVEDKRPIMLGKLPVLHGHELPNGISAPVNPARGAFMRTLSTVLVGHSHRTSGHAESNMWHEEIFCWSTGCLCELTPGWQPINRWNHGFATVNVEKSGQFAVTNFRITSDGTVRGS
jgi:predicted phosphodiesterase